MKKQPKTQRFIIEIASEARYDKEDIESYLRQLYSSLTPGEKVRVIKATASAIRRLGDQQT